MSQRDLGDARRSPPRPPPIAGDAEAPEASEPAFVARIERALRKGQTRSRAALKRLVGILDLDPPLKPEAIKAAVLEELEDQRHEALRALGDLTPSGEAHDKRTIASALAALDRSQDFPRVELTALLGQASPRVQEALQRALGRHARFAERLEWLLSPSTAAEIAALDPWEHRNRIYHFVSYEFRLEQKLFAFLFELAPMMVPYGAAMFAATGEFSRRAYQRINDTAMFFANLLEWGLESKRGRTALARLNEIHGRYSLPNELFLFTLSGIMFLPDHFNEKLGWRRFTTTETLGWFYSFVELGRAMNIADISDDYAVMRQRWQRQLERVAESSPVGQRAVRNVLSQVLATYPPELRKPLLAALFCGMPDFFRDTLGIPPPSGRWLEDVRQGLRWVGITSASLPRSPWLRSLQLYPTYRNVERIGVGGRSADLPRRPQSGSSIAERDLAVRLRDNDGRPQFQKPLASPTDIPPQDLPKVSAEEVARHHTLSDGWLIIFDQVYDVTAFLALHPGGQAVLEKHLGGDASRAFEAIGHSDGAKIMLDNFRIATLPSAVTEPAPAPPISKVHTGRKQGRTQRYGEQAFDLALDELLEQVAEDEQAKRERLAPEA